MFYKVGKSKRNVNDMNEDPDLFFTDWILSNALDSKHAIPSNLQNELGVVNKMKYFLINNNLRISNYNINYDGTFSNLILEHYTSLSWNTVSICGIISTSVP